MTFKFGRNRPIARAPRLSLKNYLLRGLPSPPATCDYTVKAASPLSQMYLNDNLGDCVIACIAHAVGVFTGNVGAPFLFSADQITKLYGEIGGYVPGDASTDQGCDEQTALAYWENNGAPDGAHQILGWLAVNGRDPAECRAAIWLFENLVFGVELPDEWINPFPSASGFTWDVAGDPDENNGHCFGAFGYTAKTLSIATWGLTGYITDAAVDEYTAGSTGGELYTVLSMDSISKATAKTPGGLDATQLIADFQAIGGKTKTLLR